MQGLGVTLVVMIVAAGQEAPPGAEPTPQEVRAAIGRSLPFLEGEGVAWKETKGCTSCHHVPMMIWTHHEAEKHGFTIDKGAVEEAESWALGQYLKHPEFMPTGQDKSFPRRGPGPGSVYLALGVGAAEHKGGPAAEALGKLSGHFARMQEGDGSWAIKQSTPPLVDGDDVATMLILLAMDKTDTDAAGEARRKALEWLERAPRRDETQPLALRAMVAARFGNGDEAKQSAARLRERQDEDGGWGQVDGAAERCPGDRSGPLRPGGGGRARTTARRSGVPGGSCSAASGTTGRGWSRRGRPRGTTRSSPTTAPAGRPSA